MKSEKTKGNGTKNEGADFGCCNPENFKGMFEKMSKCFPAQDGSTDFSTMKDGMMKMRGGGMAKKKNVKKKMENWEEEYFLGTFFALSYEVPLA